jgi:hypothetical protein
MDSQHFINGSFKIAPLLANTAMIACFFTSLLGFSPSVLNVNGRDLLILNSKGVGGWSQI